MEGWLPAAYRKRTDGESTEQRSDSRLPAGRERDTDSGAVPLEGLSFMLFPWILRHKPNKQPYFFPCEKLKALSQKPCHEKMVPATSWCQVVLHVRLTDQSSVCPLQLTGPSMLNFLTFCLMLECLHPFLKLMLTLNPHCNSVGK